MAKRLFLAICPPMSLTQTIAQSIRLPIDCRPVPAENYHVTLVFLGLVEPEVQVEICRSMAQVQSTPFTVQFRQITHWEKPKVLCLTDSKANGALLNVVTQIKKSVEKLGVSVERRPFQAHLTVAKGVLRPHVDAVNRISWQVDSFCLLESISVSPGVRYAVIQKWDF
ncbi:MAG: RNA 2',3'-cyclic phosphodiesterase [Methylococcaceae bacterium]|nr:RNA 2',3'-cyclic phosphodiesterase [Methylococcaceae bacterium]